MNFLAHCLIGAQARPEARDGALVAGGFLGDFIKGTVPSEMPSALAQGVRLHRRVDAFSNRHPDIRASCRRFPAELRRIAPILVDIIGDHLLARRWTDFHPEPLKAFTASTYEAVAAHGEWLPVSGHRFLGYAREQDLLASYGDWSVVSGSLRSITRRLKRSELNRIMEAALPPLLSELEGDFLSYFPDMVAHATEWLALEEAGRETHERPLEQS